MVHYMTSDHMLRDCATYARMLVGNIRHHIYGGGAAHRPPEGRAGHRAVGEETDPGRQFRISRRGSVRRRERRRERYVEEYRLE